MTLTHVLEDIGGHPHSVWHPSKFPDFNLSDNNPTKCTRCFKCPARDHWYGRFDEGAPPVVHAVSHYLSSIPSKNRLPHNISLWPTYFQDKSNAFPNRKYLLEYNPSIVRIPTHQIPELYRVENVVYLASFRVSTIHSCAATEGLSLAMMGYEKDTKDFERPYPENHVGFALLREDLSIISDALFTFDNMGQGTPEDIRLFVLNDQLYWGSFYKIHAMWLVEPQVPRPWVREIPPMSGDWSPIIVDTMPVCPIPITSGGKNLQFFMDGERVIAEVSPMGRKVEVNLTAKCPKSILDSRPFNTTLPARSFGTVDELHFWKHGVHKSPVSSERGSACCVPMQHQNRSLLLGVSHSKFRFRDKKTRGSLPGNVSSNHFFSSFYLMEPTEPYTVIARSGRFCLGFSGDQEVATQNPYGQAARNKRLRLGLEEFDCPGIHYVSGLVETPDEDHVIVAYGVADCTPRMIKVRKADVMRILLPYETAFGETRNGLF
eukprot:scaffold75_cov165-Amphora_coffeaeformis.AAC.23